MKLKELLASVEYKVINGTEDVLCAEITDVTDISGECSTGSVFVCVEGRRTDGHSFAFEAVDNGAVALVCSYGRGEEIREFTASFGDVCVIEVADTRSAYAKLCGVFFGHCHPLTEISGKMLDIPYLCK